jgi:hypothetical protein
MVTHMDTSPPNTTGSNIHRVIRVIPWTATFTLQETSCCGFSFDDPRHARKKSYGGFVIPPPGHSLRT